jgi:hypothetical protein
MLTCVLWTSFVMLARQTSPSTKLESLQRCLPVIWPLIGPFAAHQSDWLLACDCRFEVCLFFSKYPMHANAADLQDAKYAGWNI